jgi:GTP-binding protein
LINNSLYLVDLPGYGFAKLPRRDRERIEKMINWYFFESPYEQKAVAVIIDANVGLTGNDLEMLMSLEKQGKHIIIVANKVDKIKKSQYAAQLQEIKGRAGDSKVIPYSAHKGTGLQELINEIVRR